METMTNTWMNNPILFYTAVTFFHKKVCRNSLLDVTKSFCSHLSQEISSRKVQTLNQTLVPQKTYWICRSLLIFLTLIITSIVVLIAFLDPLPPALSFCRLSGFLAASAYMDSTASWIPLSRLCSKDISKIRAEERISLTHCLKITQNVAYEFFFNFGIFHQFLSY